MTRSNSTELIIFGSMERVAGLRRIQLRQYDSDQLMSNGATGKLGQLVTDEYIIPGVITQMQHFEGPWKVGTEHVVIRSSDPDKIFLFSADDGYVLRWLPNYRQGDPVDEKAVLGGYKKMEDGTVAKLYILTRFGMVRYYNSHTKSSYDSRSSDNTQSSFSLMIVEKR